MSDSRALERVRWVVLLAVPSLLFGPILLGGGVFLPQLPVSLEPFRTELPEVSERAREDQNYTQSDRLYPTLTDQLAMRDAVRSGHAPTWEPRLGLGVPLYAQSIAGGAYPPNWLALVVPPERAAAPLALLGMFLAGLGAWLFLGRMGVGFGARVFGALAFQLGGWGVANLYDFIKVDSALWLPWSLWAVEGIARGKRHSGLALTVSLAASLVAGMVQIGVLVLAFVAIYVLLRLSPVARLFGFDDDENFQTKPQTTAPILAGVSFVVLGAVSAFAFLLPILEASRQSDRQWKPSAELVSESLPAATVMGTVVHDFFGAPTESTASGALPVAWWVTPSDEAYAAQHANQLEWNTYAGAIVVALALVGLVAAPRRASLPLVLLLGTLGFAQGWPIVRAAYGLPGLNAGTPGRSLALAWFLWPWLAAIGVQAVWDRRPRAWPAFVAVATLFSAVSLVLWSTMDPSAWAESLEATLISRYDELTDASGVRARLPFEASVAAGERLRASYAVFSVASLSLVVAAVAAIALRRAGNRVAAPWAERVCCAVFVLAMIGEGVVASDGHITSRPIEGDLFPDSEAIDAIARAAGDGRVIRYDPTASGLEHVVNLARPNVLQAYGIADAMPWMVFPARTYNELFAALDPLSRKGQGVARISDPRHLSHPILDLVRATAVLSRDSLEHPRLEPILERPGLHVYRRSGAFGPARLVAAPMQASSDAAALLSLASQTFDLARTTLLAPEVDYDGTADETATGAALGRVAAFTRPAPNRIRIRVEDAVGGLLVIHEQFYPGWTATVNGAHAELMRTDHVYQAVRIEAGSSDVELHYRPASVSRGLFLSIAALLAAAFFSHRQSA